MATATSSPEQTNKVMETIHKLMGPALFVLLGSSIFRGLLGLIIASLSGQLGSYNRWSPAIRLPIEILVFLGVFIASDVCFAQTVYNCEEEKKRKQEILNEEPPKFRGKDDVLAQQVSTYEKNKAGRVAFADSELKVERKARFFFGFISVFYALNFVAQGAVAINDTWETIILLFIEGMSIIIVPYVIWYSSARYRATKKDIKGKAEGIVESGVDARLQAIVDNANKSDLSDEDINLADAVLDSKHPYKRFMPALRKVPNKDDLLTTADIFAVLGVDDTNTQRKIRRLIKTSFDQHTKGVFQIMEGSKPQWRVSGEAFYKLFAKFMNGGQGMDTGRTNGPRQRPSRKESSGQSPVTVQSVTVPSSDVSASEGQAQGNDTGSEVISPTTSAPTQDMGIPPTECPADEGENYPLPSLDIASE